MTSFVPFNRDQGSHIWHARIGRVMLKEMANVVSIGIQCEADIPASRVLGGAFAANLSSVVVMGWDKDGELYFASSMADGGTVLWLTENMKAALMGFRGPYRTHGPTPA